MCYIMNVRQTSKNKYTVSSLKLSTLATTWGWGLMMPKEKILVISLRINAEY